MRRKHSLSTQHIGETITSMSENLPTSNEIISTIPGAFRDFKSTADETRNAVDAMKEKLAGVMKTVMNQILDPTFRPLVNTITTTEMRFDEQQRASLDGELLYELWRMTYLNLQLVYRTN
jgi:hypothetical protein